VVPAGGIPFGGAASWFLGWHAAATTKRDATEAQVESVRMKGLLKKRLARPRRFFRGNVGGTTKTGGEPSSAHDPTAW